MPKWLHRFKALILFFLFFLSCPVGGEELSRPSLNAILLDKQIITIDGLLDEPVWQSEHRAAGFVQQRPQVGAPAQGETFAWVAYDQNNLYIGAVLNDPDPSLVRGDERHRDAAFERSDAFAVLVDTYHDHQNGFVFEANILSAMSDAVISQEGERINQDWDGLWEAAARRTPNGWSAEFRIPFETLRFRPGETQTWGIQFRRRIPHLKEVSFWSPLTSEQDFFEVSRAGHLVGMKALQQERRLSIKPYGKGSFLFSRNDLEDAWDVEYDMGLDLRYRFRANLILDLTFNTDFAETEVDRFQINLTRFPFFFPEKREFFLEGKGFYDFGLTGRLQPFFSRRIGLVRQRPVQILGGAKLTGKVGPYGIGALYMGTGEEEAIGLDAERFAVARLTRNLGVRSNVGFIGTHRTGDEAREGEGFGFDTTIAPNPNLMMNAFWIRTTGTDLGEPGEAGYSQVHWRDPFWRILLYHLRVDERFEPVVGFVQQTDLHETQGYIDIRPQPVGGPVREFGFKTEMTHQTETDGDFLYRSNYNRIQAEFWSGDFLLTSIDPQRERLPNDFEVRPGIVIPAEIYRYTHYNIMFISDARRLVSIFTSYKWGGFYGGRQNSIDLSLTFAPSEGLKLGAGWDVDWVDLPQGNFFAQILSGDVAWAATNTTLFRGLFQWDRESRALAANLRFAWEYRPGSHLFLIANPLRFPEGETYLFIIKLTRLW